ncbi:hypothetical protein XENOCAPTIV_015245, partial [Xenoophorus captivus]
IHTINTPSGIILLVILSKSEIKGLMSLHGAVAIIYFLFPHLAERRQQGKFQPFRRLFGKKKKREAKRSFDGAELKASFSTGEVCSGVVSDNEESNKNLRDLNPIGSRALSHDSVFITEEPLKELSLDHSMSQENVSDKVRNLQVQGAQSSGQYSTPVKSPRSKRVLPPTGTIESINLDAVPQSVPRLDNTAAKHKLLVKPKNQRISRKHRRFTLKLRLREMEQEKQLALAEQMKMLTEEDAGSSDEQERKRRAEEQRWREMEERQRPFSFKVSSGEKQILFQKVNLTPVTPSSSHQSAADADQREGATASSLERQDPSNLPASSYVPHTAILVTGAQLCGTAVNLDQIKDTACKSLLGLGEERRAQGIPSAKSKSSPDHKSGKTKSLSESSFCPDQSSAAVLAEWASIRSKIFKGVEDGKYDEYPGPPSRNQPQITSEEQPPFSHTSLRKTMSASAKFSITPAKKKFGDSNRNSEVFNADNKDGKEEASQSDSPTPASQSPTFKPHTRTSKTVRIVERGSEECMFAKDLPSFLVPSPGDIPEGSEAKSHLQSKTEEGEAQGQDGEDNASPFGIKLRRTNYSLRFHSEQSTEKRKKRYSAGDSFDGVPSPLTPIEPDSDTSSVFSDKSSPTSPQKEGVLSKYLHASASPAITEGKLGKPTSPIGHNEGEKVLSKPPLYRRPATSPKPSGATPTPPPSPLPKVAHVLPCEDVIQRTGSPDLSVQEQAGRSEEPSTVAQLHRGNHSPVQGEEEPKEKRSFFPSINIPWREKADRKAELIRREKPSLQARLSLDSARVQEKEAGPLWITLALQKQKGFREQQQSREERRSQREAKLAEKHARERDSVALVSPTECKESGCTSPSSKPQTPEEPKRPDSLLGRFERRDPLKKASTLPSSVTGRDPTLQPLITHLIISNFGVIMNFS